MDISIFWRTWKKKDLGFESMGNLIYEADLSGFSWNGKTENGNWCSDGTYFYRVSDSNIAGFIELMR